MDRNQDKSLPSEFNELEERLRQGRAQVSGLELDELKLRAMSQARQAEPKKLRPGGQILKSRLALVAMIVVGLMMSTTGVGLAVSGSSGAGSAADNEYPLDKTGTGGNQTVAGQEQGTGPASAESPAGADQGTQDVQQASTSGNDGLPFTGFLAIPLLIGGVALTGTGAALRRKAQD